MTSTSLQDCTIVVTRPVAQAGKLIKKLQGLGARVVHFPVIAISPLENQQQLLAQAKSLGNYDIAIFISRNAAIFGSALVKKTGDWPPETQIAAIGDGTAQQLSELGLSADVVPSGAASSESLLSSSMMNSVEDKRILIFRGIGGREKLADSLRKRGAIVDYLECYERKRPNNDPNILTRIWDRHKINGIILTSNEGLKNLYQMVKKDDLDRLNTTPLYVISSTMVELCGKLGYKLTPILMPSASDDDVIQSVMEHCRSQ
jgi:uroporphyrinogen-III synthase